MITCSRIPLVIEMRHISPHAFHSFNVCFYHRGDLLDIHQSQLEHQLKTRSIHITTSLPWPREDRLESVLESQMGLLQSSAERMELPRFERASSYYFGNVWPL